MLKPKVVGLSPAMMVALIALFVALSGGAAAGSYVATKQHGGPSGKHFMTAMPQIGAIRATTSVRARLLDEFKTCCRGPRGRRGPRGPHGPQGPPGPAGPARITSADGPVAHMCAFGGGACSVGSSVATCPAGTVPIGGAWAGDAPDPIFAATVSASFPYPSFTAPTGWAVIVVNDSNLTASFHASAICAG
jgi:hypothetical protein